MDSKLHENHELASDSTPEDPEIVSCGSGIFSGSRNFVVAGGSFHVINYATPPTTDFRRIPLGDIHLREELGSDGGSRTVRRVHARCSVRRVYSARVVGLEGTMTVAMYHGDRAEHEWRQDILRYSWLRHPCFMQLCGITSSSKIHAAVFHDDLIPFPHFVELHRHSPILTVYIYRYCATEFWTARDYFRSTFQQSLETTQCTFWIYRSTGRLCAELIPSDTRFWYLFRDKISNPQGITPLNAPSKEAMVLGSVSLEQYHSICCYNLARCRTITVSTPATINLGGVLPDSSRHQAEVSAEIAFLPDLDVKVGRWRGAAGLVMRNEWTRFDSADVVNCTLSANMGSYALGWTWLCQANHIFTHLNITSNFEKYVYVSNIDFEIRISGLTDGGPTGYLFVCPAKILQTGASSFRWPDCPAYWSLDPFGVDHLSTDDATRLGFPSIELKIGACRRSWDASVYAGLRKFHRAKGFDPDSQDVARHLGYPLYQVSLHVVNAEDYVSEPDNLTEAYSIHKHIPPSSKTFTFIMNVQLGLMLFLAVCWLHEHLYLTDLS